MTSNQSHLACGSPQGHQYPLLASKLGKLGTWTLVHVRGCGRQGRAISGSSFLPGPTGLHPRTDFALSFQKNTTLSTCPFLLGLGSRKSLEGTGLGREGIQVDRRCLLAVRRRSKVPSFGHCQAALRGTVLFCPSSKYTGHLFLPT